MTLMILCSRKGDLRKSENVADKKCQSILSGVCYSLVVEPYLGLHLRDIIMINSN